LVPRPDAPECEIVLTVRDIAATLALELEAHRSKAHGRRARSLRGARPKRGVRRGP
jgi:hypothetical protein